MPIYDQKPLILPNFQQKKLLFRANKIYFCIKYLRPLSFPQACQVTDLSANWSISGGMRKIMALASHWPIFGWCVDFGGKSGINMAV